MSILQDIRLALRLLRRAPVPTGNALLSIALSVGATAVVFAAIKSALLDPFLTCSLKNSCCCPANSPVCKSSPWRLGGLERHPRTDSKDAHARLPRRLRQRYFRSDGRLLGKRTLVSAQRRGRERFFHKRACPALCAQMPFPKRSTEYE